MTEYFPKIEVPPVDDTPAEDTALADLSTQYAGGSTKLVSATESTALAALAASGTTGSGAFVRTTSPSIVAGVSMQTAILTGVENAMTFMGTGLTNALVASIAGLVPVLVEEYTATEGDLTHVFGSVENPLSTANGYLIKVRTTSGVKTGFQIFFDPNGSTANTNHMQMFPDGAGKMGYASAAGWNVGHLLNTDAEGIIFPRRNGISRMLSTALRAPDSTPLHYMSHGSTSTDFTTLTARVASPGFTAGDKIALYKISIP